MMTMPSTPDQAPEIGWHQDPQEPTCSRYWDGIGWTGELRWDGTDWVAAPALESSPASAPVVPAGPAVPAAPVVEPARPAPPAQPDEASPVPVAGTSAAPLGTIGRLAPGAGAIFGGAALAAVGVLQPWEKASTPYGMDKAQVPSSVGGAAVVLFGLVGLAVWAAAPARRQALAPRRLVGVALSGLAMLGFGLAKFAAIGADQDKLNAASAPASSADDPFGSVGTALAQATHVTVQPGFGLYLWTVGAVAIGVGVVQALRAHVRNRSLGSIQDTGPAAA